MSYGHATPPEMFAALADPTRRAIVEQLRSGPMAVGEIAGHLPISRPAVSQHLKTLSDAGLVMMARAEGARRIYAIRAEGVDTLRRYLDALWGDALGDFAEIARRGGGVADSENGNGK